MRDIQALFKIASFPLKQLSIRLVFLRQAVVERNSFRDHCLLELMAVTRTVLCETIISPALGPPRNITSGEIASHLRFAVVGGA
jgi:hypothetical protein